MDDTASKIARTVAAISYLNVTHSYAAVRADARSLVSAALDCLEAGEAEMKTTATPTPTSLLTWRPAFCMDVAILPPRNTRPATLALLAHGFASRAECFTVHDSLPDLDLDGFFCAHLTVDVNDGHRQPVLLIYDFFPVHPTLGLQDMPPRDRYSIVQHAVQAWEGLRIGSVKIMRQWAGSLESLSQLEALRLPHTRSDFVCLGDTVRYARFARKAC